MNPPRSLLLVALALAVAVLVIEARVVVGGATWDDTRYHTEIAPPRLAAAAAVHGGEFPAWWDGSGLGVPLLGEPSHGAATPASWIAASPRALDLVIVLHVLWAALGVAVWARRRGATELGALVAGVLVAATGVIASAAIRGALPAVAHLPWIGWAATVLAEAEGRGRARAAVALGALVGAVALAGQPAVLADAVILALAVGARRGAARWLGAAVAAGLAVGALQWLPAALVIGSSAGARVTGLPLARLVELVVPGRFGEAGAWAPSLFVGAPLVALAAIGRPPWRLVVPLGLFAALALVWGRGGWPAWLGAPELHVAALTIVAATLAATGVDALVAGGRRAVVALACGIAVAAIGLSAIALTRADAGRLLVEGGFGLACMIAAAVIAWRAPGRRTALLLALVVAPSLAAVPSVAPVIERAAVEEAPPWALAAQREPGPRRLYRPAALHDTPDALADAIATLGGTLPARWGIAAARSDDPARPVLHDRAWLASGHQGGAMLERFGIALAILPPGMHLPALGQRGEWTLSRYPAAPPAAVFGNWSWVAAPEAALAKLFPPRGNRGLGRGLLVLEGAGVPSEAGELEPRACAIDRWRDGAIDLTCEAAEDSYAAISSTAAPGWTVTLDEREAPWVTADVLRRAVALPAGTHRVRWRYSTPGLAPGGALAGLGLLGLLALWLASRRYSPAQT